MIDTTELARKSDLFVIVDVCRPTVTGVRHMLAPDSSTYVIDLRAAGCWSIHDAVKICREDPARLYPVKISDALKVAAIHLETVSMTRHTLQSLAEKYYQDSGAQGDSL